MVPLLELLDPELLLRSLVIELVLLRIDHNHRVLDSTEQFRLRRTTNGHVRDEVGDLAHLVLECTVLHPRRSRWELEPTVVEVNELLPGSDVLDPVALVGDDQNRVAIEVRSRQLLGCLGVNADSVLGVAGDHLASGGIAVVDRQLRDLEYAAMWVADENDPLAVLVTRSVDLVWLETWNREDDVVGASRKGCGLEMH